MTCGSKFKRGFPATAWLSFCNSLKKQFALRQSMRLYSNIATSCIL